MVEDRVLDGLPLQARDAIKAAENRLERAYLASDVEGTIGGAKELIETVAKAVMDVAGAAYGSNPSVEGLAAQTLQALELHPAALQGRKSLRQLSSSVIGAAHAIAELRNTDGTGHGRATRSNVDWSHALFVRDAGVAWCNWVLATASRTLAGRAGLDEALADIGGARAFSKGKLAAFLEELRLPELQEADQRRLGLSVARRWTVNETFMPLMDIVDPIADGDADYPPAFCEGIVEGLLLDHNGYIRTTDKDIQRAIRVGWRLPVKRRKKLFEELVDRIGEARPSSVFDADAQSASIDALLESSGERQNAAIRDALVRIARQLEASRVGSAPAAHEG